MTSLLVIAILCILVVIFILIFFIIKDLIQIDNKITELNNIVVSKNENLDR